MGANGSLTLFSVRLGPSQGIVHAQFSPRLHFLAQGSTFTLIADKAELVDVVTEIVVVAIPQIRYLYISCTLARAG